MQRTDRLSPWAARSLSLVLLLLGLAQPMAARADTVCVNTVAEFVDAYEQAVEQEQTINVVTGVYLFADDPGAVGSLRHDLAIVGGWNANCSARQPDPRLTVFRGATDIFDLVSRESIRIDSIAFIDSGRVALRARASTTTGGDKTIRLERVWFQNVCAGDGRCGNATDEPVLLRASRVQLSQVVVTDNRAAGCGVLVDSYDLHEVSVAFSLFTANDSRGLCIRAWGPEGTDDYTLRVENSIFWNNAQDDLLTRGSPFITLRNNIYQSLDLSPGADTLPVQTLGVDPQFQNAASRDFRLQSNSPAINSGRLGSIFVMPEQDLDGGARVIGPAPDRGPFESSSAESTFQVTNTVDTLSPVVTGSLRWAIEQANATPGLDRIRFALPSCPQIIELNAPLPDITDGVFIDGYSQAGSARNESVRGFTPTLCVALRDSALALDHALRIPAEAGDETFVWVSGLAFGGFDVAAVRIAAGSNSWIFGNRFGGSLGATALGNNAVNVRLGGTSHDNLVGGLELSQRNLIGSAYVAGVEILDNGSGAEGYDNTVRNNLIGLDANGQDAAPNALGVRVRTAINTVEDNYISGNQGDGILIEGPLAYSNQIRDNVIGRKTFDFCLPPCTPDYALGNAGAGVRQTGSGYDNWIRFNRIAYNGGAGVRIEGGHGHALLHNSISANEALGIDLGTAGVNPVYNSGLAVTAPYANRGITAPTLTAASGSGEGGRVAGQIAARNGAYRVQFFRNAGCDASGRGEGLEPLNIEPVTIANAPVGGNGSASFDFELPADVGFDGAVLAAVLIDDDQNASEFSACRAYETIACREIFRDGLEDNPPPALCTPP